MGETTTRAIGLVLAVTYAAFIGWLYARQPQTIAQVTGGLSAVVGAYSVNEEAFADGLRFFRNDQFVEARMAFARADPAVRDAQTQFYVAYSYYRQGWGRLYHDDRLYADGLLAIDRAIALAVAYAVFIGWLFARQPQTIAQVTGGLSAVIGAYTVDDQALADGLRFFRNGQFVEARMAFARADPAVRDARTQFYVAYSCYRQGWGRLYHDDRLYAEGLSAIDHAMNVRLVVDDPDLAMHTAEELKAELEAGIRRDASDLNPMRLFRVRK